MFKKTVLEYRVVNIISAQAVYLGKQKEALYGITPHFYINSIAKV
jgi:hypothetical protein